MKGLFKIILATLIIANSYKGVFATNIDTSTDDTIIDDSWDLNQNYEEKEDNITLDGMIGPYDPSDLDDDDPDFSQISDDELEGKRPDNYYTISVTVPTSMHFTVISGNARGQFYSPKYTIENKATRPIYVSVKGIQEQDIDESQFEKLYLRTPKPYDEYMEIDLYFSMLNTSTLEKNIVRLSEFDASSDNYLGKIALKQSAILQFEATDWDVPGIEAPDKYAKNDFTLQLEFSLENPNQPSQPENPTNPSESVQP